MRTVILITISIIMLLFSSCSKNSSYSKDELESISIQSANRQNAVKKNNLIKRQVSFSSNNSLLKSVSEFMYDEQGRVSQVRTGIIDSSLSNPQFQVRMTFILNYNGLSQHPHSTARILSVFPNLVSTTYHKYNRFGDKILDSISVKNVNGEFGYHKAVYEYNKKDIYATSSNLGFASNHILLDTLTLKNNNIQKQVASRMTPNGEIKNVIIYNYDNKSNPFNQLNVFNSLYFTNPTTNNGFLSPLPYIGINKNNITSYTIGEVAFKFDYVYDAKGYPIRQNTFFPQSSTPDLITFYQY